ncbi:MAG: hypothetical protein HY327_09645 [Chloroflexi bacterium]|nr:hypothetical protein [Chloroflexota bacterium]
MKTNSARPSIVLAILLAACAPSTIAQDAPTPPFLPSPTRGEVAPATATRPLATQPPAPITGAPKSQISGNVSAAIPACPADISTPLLTTVPIDLENFIAFRPLGFLSPPIHTIPAKHSAFSMTLPGQQPQKKPVKSPGKAWVAEIWEASFSAGNKNYQVFIYPCREVKIYFGHIVSVSEKLQAEFKKGEPRCNSFQDGTSTVTTCRREQLAIPLEAGEQFGEGPDSAGVDFGLADYRLKPAAFIKPEHYGFDYPYWASPLDYFTPEVKARFATKFGSVFGTRFRAAEPIGGMYMQDLPGTAQGSWFIPGQYHSNSTDLSSIMSLAHDFVDPAQPIFAIGNSIKGLNMGLYSFAPQSAGRINRDFSAIKADGAIYCYDNFLQGQSQGGMPLGKPNGIVLLTMPTDLTLKIELQSGARCDANAAYALTANATAFER